VYYEVVIDKHTYDFSFLFSHAYDEKSGVLSFRFRYRTTESNESEKKISFTFDQIDDIDMCTMTDACAVDLKWKKYEKLKHVVM